MVVSELDWTFPLRLEAKRHQNPFSIAFPPTLAQLPRLWVGRPSTASKRERKTGIIHRIVRIPCAAVFWEAVHQPWLTRAFDESAQKQRGPRQTTKSIPRRLTSNWIRLSVERPYDDLWKREGYGPCQEPLQAAVD